MFQKENSTSDKDPAIFVSDYAGSVSIAAMGTVLDCYTKYGELSLDFSSLASIDAVIKQALILFLKKYNKKIISFTLKVEYGQKTIEAMREIALLINELPLLDGTKLVVRQGGQAQNTSHTDKLFCFMRHLENPSIKLCDLSSNELGKTIPDTFLSFARDLSRQPFSVSLHNNHLNFLGLDTFRTFLEILNEGVNLNLDLSQNQLETFGCDKLFALQEKHKAIALSFFSSNDDENVMQALKLACEQASFQTQYLWAAMYYKSLLLSQLLPPDKSSEQKIFCFNLTSHQKLEILCILLEMGPSENNFQLACFLHAILRSFSLEPSHLFIFACKILSFSPDINISEYVLRNTFALSTLQLKNTYQSIEPLNLFDQMMPEHRIKLLLDIFERDREVFYNSMIFEYLSVFQVDHPSSKIIQTLQGIYRQNFKDYPEVDAVRDRLLTMTLPALRPALKKVSIPIETENLLVFIENYRKQHTGEDGILPTTNMIEWLVWACAKLTLHPTLCQTPEQASDEQQRTWNITNVVFTKVLKETLQFASPQGRYTLTTALLNNLSDHKTSLELSPYVQINEDGSNATLLASIPLAQIINPMIASEADPKKKREIIDQIKDIIALMPLGQCPGRHYRTIVNTLLVLSDNKTLQPQEKLKLIKQMVERGIFAQVVQLIKLLNNPEEEAKYLKIWASLQIKNPALIQKLQETLKLDTSFKALSMVENRKLIRRYQREFMQGVVPKHFSHLKESDFKMLLSDFILLQGLSNLGKLPDIYGVGDSFETKCRDIFKELFDLEDYHFTHYTDTVVDYRNSAGLLTYYSKMQSLNSETGKAVLALFKKFVKALLSEGHQDFYAMRYDMQDNPHMQALFSKQPDLEEKWKAGKQYDLESFLKNCDIVYKQYQPDLNSLIYKKMFGHKHLDTQYYNYLKDYIDAKNPEEKDQAKQKSLDYQASLKLSVSMQAETEEARHANIQVALIELLETPLDHDHVSTHHYEPALKILRNIENMLYQFRPHPQFSHDIKGIIAGLKTNFYPPKNNAFKGWYIMDTDHPWDLLMAGTDVEGSCQAIDGDPDLNQCLMAYVMDPKNRMLAIQDAQGVTIARCILRLLVDDEGNTALFIEEIYPDNIRSDFKGALQTMARQRAQNLTLPLLSLESTLESYVYPSPVHSRYSPAPTEYVDALYGDQEDGEFTIPAPQCLLDPRLQLKEQVQTLPTQALQTDAEPSSIPGQSSIIFGWEAWKADYQTIYPLREAEGYGPGAIIVRP